jgi:adenosylcobinamide kinase/adenosylcobinamide-phosphate guanylyltransferase
MLAETETRTKSVTLVLGGAQSGKSHYAQQLALPFERVTFIATGRRIDAEMRKKIARHRRERPVSWRTIEAPMDLHKAIHCESQQADVVLIDCLTVYVDNVMGAGKKSKSHPNEHIEAVCVAIRASKASVIVVSNEVGSGIVPEYRSGRIYRDFLGQMNRNVAEIADTVVLMVAGVPVTIKDSATNRPKSEPRIARREAGELTAPANGVRRSHFRSKETFK